MYSRQEASQIRQEFWTSFGRYMTPVLSAEGERVNWMNYKTGEKDIRFKMQADNKTAVIAIELSHKDAGLQALYFEQFLELKNSLHGALGEEWNWQLHGLNEAGSLVSRIYTELAGVNIFRREDWPALISFFKPRMIALDDFWSSAKYGFEALRS